MPKVIFELFKNLTFQKVKLNSLHCTTKRGNTYLLNKTKTGYHFQGQNWIFSLTIKLILCIRTFRWNIKQIFFSPYFQQSFLILVGRRRWKTKKDLLGCNWRSRKENLPISYHFTQGIMKYRNKHINLFIRSQARR